MNETHHIGVSGAHWMQNDQQKFLGPGAITSRVLCSHHNSQLSNLDAFGLKFFKSMAAILDAKSENELNPLTNQSLDGPMLQRWFLKLFCGVLRSRVMSDESGELLCREIPKEWLSLLFDATPWSPGTGLHFETNSVQAISTKDFFAFELLYDSEDKLDFIRCRVFGLPVVLAMVPIWAMPEVNGLAQLGGFRFRKWNIQKEIAFDWPNGEDLRHWIEISLN